MNLFLLLASLLCCVLGILHSLLGEKYIFQSDEFKKGGDSIRLKFSQIIRATWHLASIFGWVFSVILFLLANFSSKEIVEWSSALYVMATGLLISAFLVSGLTHGKHPGWIVLTIISLLIYCH